MQADFITQAIDPYNGAMQTGRPAKTKRSDFGARLYALREAAGLSQAQVADKLGVAQPTYALWERRTTAIATVHLQKLAEIFGVGVEALFTDSKTRARRGGPVGKAKALFDRLSALPRDRQQKILGTVEDMLLAHEVRKAG